MFRRRRYRRDLTADDYIRQYAYRLWCPERRKAYWTVEGAGASMVMGRFVYLARRVAGRREELN